MSYETRLTEMGIMLPEAPKPGQPGEPAIQVGDYVYASEQIPLVNGIIKYQGKLGREVLLEEGYEAAKVCVINCLAAIKRVIGDLDNVDQVVKLVGYVNSMPGFVEQPKVVAGAAELVEKVFDSAEGPVCSAVGVAELPFNSAVKVDLIVTVKR